MSYQTGVQWVQAAVQRGGTVARVVAEAVRLYSPGMDVRMAQQRLQLPSSSGCVTILPVSSPRDFPSRLLAHRQQFCACCLMPRHKTTQK